MKKTILLIIAIVVAAALAITLTAAIPAPDDREAANTRAADLPDETSEPSDDEIMYGDCTGDGSVDGKDLIRLRKYLDNLDESTGTSSVGVSPGADCTGDGNIDGKDLIRLRKYLDNLDPSTGQSTVQLGKTDPPPATTEEETEEPEVKPILDNVFTEFDAKAKNSFVSPKQTSVSVTDEGIKLSFTSGAPTDPFIFFNIGNYARTKGKPALEGEYGNFVLFKIKSAGGDGEMELFPVPATAGDSAKTNYDADMMWQYVIVDMRNTTFPTAQTLSSLRIDWSGGGTKSGAYMIISEIGFFKTEAEAMEYAGISADPGTAKRIKTVTIPEKKNADKYITSQDAAVTLENDSQAGVVAAITSGAANSKVYLNIAECAKAQKASVEKGRYVVVTFKANKLDGMSVKVISFTDSLGTVKSVAKSAPISSESGWQSILVDLKGIDGKSNIVKKLALELDGFKSGGKFTLRSITFTPDLNEALTVSGHPEYCLNIEELSDNDPLADSKLTAPYEDASLDLWFDQTTEKTYRADTESTGKTGYTVRMAKNEAENCQFFLAPQTDKEITVTVDEFKNANGDKVDFEFYYEYYHNINNSMIPDALPPVTGSLQVKGGNSQGFVIQLTTKPTTPAGTYDSMIHVYDTATGHEIKRAAVSVKVWDFELSEKTELRTAFALWTDYVINSYNWNTCGFSQQEVVDNYYEFFLKYRINIMDNPHGLTSSYAARFLSMDRVNTARWSNLDYSVTDDNGGVRPSWMDKVIYYTVDEPRETSHFKNLIEHTNRIKANTPDYRMVCPLERDLYLKADGTVTTVQNADFDSVGFLAQYTNIWCPKLDAFTSRDLSFYSGTSFLQSKEQDAKYGTFTDRMKAEVADGDELWAYICVNPTEPYVNWQLLSDGTETIVSLWQFKEYNCTGLLYWAVDYWKVNYWGSDPWTGGAFGDGMLIYSGYKFGLPSPVSSLRLENIRDGIEDYQMLCMLEEKLGTEALNDMISRITTSVVTYTDNDDYIHAVRVLLGDMLEEAYAK